RIDAAVPERPIAGSRRHSVARRFGLEFRPRRLSGRAAIQLFARNRLLFRRVAADRAGAVRTARRVRRTLCAGLLRGFRSRISGTRGGAESLLPADLESGPFRGRLQRPESKLGRQGAPGDQSGALPGTLARPSRSGALAVGPESV